MARGKSEVNAVKKVEPYEILSTTESAASCVVDRKALLASLNEAKRLADAKSTIPILSKVRLCLVEGALRVQATDLNQWHLNELKVTGESTFDDCADAKKVVEIVKALESDEVRLEQRTVTHEVEYKVEKGLLCQECGHFNNVEDVAATCGKPTGLGVPSTKCGGALAKTRRATNSNVSFALIGGEAKFTLVTLPGKDWPKAPDLSKLEWQRVPGAVLRDLVDATYFSISQDEMCSHLNGMMLEVRDGALRACSTDGHRLSLASRPSDLKPARQVIIPRGSVAELRRLVNKAGEVDLCFTQDYVHVRIVNQTSVFAARLTDAQFPPYEQVIPREIYQDATVDRARLLKSVKRMLLSASEKTHGVKLTFSPEKLTLSTDDAEGNAAQESLSCNTLIKEFSVGINGEYLLEALDHMSAARVWLGMNKLDPIVIKAQPGDLDCYVVMPMRI